jgi:ribosomal protein L7/L12
LSYDDDSLTRHFEAINERFRRVEEQLARISQAVGVAYEAPGSGVPPEVIELARAGKQIEAIKAYRAATNASLANARDVVLSL